MKKTNLENDLAFIQTMIVYANKAVGILDKAHRYGIPLNDEMVVDSLAMNLGQIGEQLDSKKLSKRTQDKYAHLVEWSAIKKFRDKAYHHYSNMDGAFIIQTTKMVLPKLIETLTTITEDLAKHHS